MNKRWKYYISIVTISATLLVGCSVAKNDQVKTEILDSNNSVGTNLANTIDTSTVVVDTEFSARDLDVGYEESTATHITLNETKIDVSGNGATATNSILTIKDEGTYVITGTLKNGQIVVDAKDTDKVQIVLNGATITCESNAPIYIKNADKVFITLQENTKNALIDGAEYIQTDENNVDGVIFSRADLTLNGSGTLNITGNYKHGILSKDDLVITGGTYNITAIKDALNGKDCVKIKDGTLTLSTTTGNGIQSKNGDDTTKGYVYICGGDITVLKCNEGIEGTVILIEDGTINITAEDDGFNAASGTSDTDNGSTTDDKTTEGGMKPEGGIIPEDGMRPEGGTMPEGGMKPESGIIPEDGMKPEGGVMPEGGTMPEGRPNRGEDSMTGGFGGFGGGGENPFAVDANCYIAISGGTITIDAAGDGIDSNGNLSISGGTIYVNGPTSGGDGSLDYNGTAEITGGTVMVAGSAGMAQGFSETSSQYSLLYNFATVSSEGTKVTLTNKNGKEVISYTPNKEYQSVVISSPDLQKDETYTLTSGEQTAEITLTSITTSNGQMGGQGEMQWPGNIKPTK